MDMDVLAVLEEKIKNLVQLVSQLRSENNSLRAENKHLQEQVEALETSVLNDRSAVDQEKELTRLVVDGLIESIDALVESESK